MSYRREPGDWICAGCGKTNWKKRTECVGCRGLRYNSPVERSQITHKAGDWNCAGCGELQFASRVVCRKCNTPKNLASAERPPAERVITHKEGDWNCLNCGKHQFASRGTCRDCFTQRGFLTLAPPERQALITPDDDNDTNTCCICFDRPKDCAIIHGGTAHIACCFVCASATKAQNQGCPICRQPIELVVQQYTV